MVILLGPQRRRPTVGAVVAEQGLTGPFALVTAGWQERESEDEELAAALGGETVNLALYQRFDAAIEIDGALAARLGERQQKLRDLQELYRLRLGDAMRSARRLAAMQGDLVAAEERAAIEVVRELDRHHVERVEEIQQSYLSPSRAIDDHARQIAERIAACEAVVIAGGHVAVLLNRLATFGLEGALGDKPVIAWSAGAMAIAERIVLFHDSPPQGPGNAELLGRGIGLFEGVLPLPDGTTRLSLADSLRVSLFARRFAEMRPAVLDAESRLAQGASGWQASAVSTLTRDGQVVPW